MAFDLQPLTKELIQELGLTTHELWMVKIGETVYGPFQTESLKHYSYENQIIFEEAFASRVENNDWQPFFSLAHFQRRGPQIKIAESEKYWVLVNGQKTGPFSQEDLEKKLESGSISPMDLISQDNGENWHKVFQDAAFEHRKHVSGELPESPADDSFKKTKFDLIGAKVSSPENLASLAFLGQQKEKTTALKLDEITVKNVSETEVSRSLKWALPMAIGVVVTLVVTGYYLLSPSAPPVELTEAGADEINLKAPVAPVTAPPQIESTPRVFEQAPLRRPSSTFPRPAERSALTQPTYEPPPPSMQEPEREPEDYQDPGYRDEVPQEHNIASRPKRSSRPAVDREPAEYDLDADEPASEPVRESASEPPAPVVEEVSDF